MSKNIFMCVHISHILILEKHNALIGTALISTKYDI